MNLKKTISLFLALIILLSSFSVLAFSTDEILSEPIFTEISDSGSKKNTGNPKSLKLLAIGNSFSDDAVQYLYTLAKKAGAKNVVIASMDVPGCDLKIHCTNAREDLPIYKYSKCAKSTGGKMKIYNNFSILSALKDENWDYVTLQQSSALSGIAKTYNSDLEYLVSYVLKNRPLKTTKLCWHMTWAYAKNFKDEKFEPYDFNQNEMYKAICGAVKKKIESNKKFEVMIPVGTAIQNLRTSYIGDRLNRDGRHLNDIGRYVAALSFMKALGFNIDEISWVPKSKEFFVSYLPAIISSVNSAAEKPLKLTDESGICNHTPGKNGALSTVVVKKGYPATCAAEGLGDGLYCKVCKQYVKPQKVLPKNENHSFDYTVLTPATTKENGLMTGVCTVCKKSENFEIARIKKAVLSKTTYTFTGKAPELSFSVVDANGKKLEEGKDYSIGFGSNGRSGIGKHTAKLTFKNRYGGKAEFTFTVTPKKTALKKLSGEKGGFVAEWKKAENVCGYVVEYSKSPSFDGKTLKRVKFKNPNTVKKFLKTSESGVYYVRIRTYFETKSGAFYSPWSKSAKVKAK